MSTFLDIEKVINQKDMDSRFKLVHIAALRARQLNNPDENTPLSTLKPGEKVTTKSLTDIVNNRVKFIEVTDEENEVEVKEDQESI